MNFLTPVEPPLSGVVELEAADGHEATAETHGRWAFRASTSGKIWVHRKHR